MSIDASAAPFSLLTQYVEALAERGEIAMERIQSENSYLACSAGAEHYLIRMDQVFEVARELPDITPLPFTPNWLLGLSSHRGEVCSVTDFKYFVDQKRKYAPQKGAYYIILRDAGQGYVLKMDSVSGIRQVEVNPLTSKRAWIDGHIYMEEKDWLRINLGHLVNDALFSQQMQ